MTKNAITQGFTLAEVLITLGIIGVVAAMTIPTLVADYQKRTYDTAATTFERKLGEALKVMNSQQTLAGFNSTEDFVDELSKHFKITKTCSNDKLMDCFEEEVSWGSNNGTPETVDMTKVKKVKHFGQKDWQQTDIVGVQFASGVSALIAYNKDAKQDPYSNQIVNVSGSSNGRSGYVSLGTDALAILYDTNGLKSPNQSAKDLRSLNVTKLGNSCFKEIDGICITMQAQVVPYVTKEECEAMKSTHGIQSCYYETDYWAGAVKLCGGVDNLPTSTDLTKLANYIYSTSSYNANVSESARMSFNTDRFNRTRLSELGLPDTTFAIWGSSHSSSGYYSGQNAYDRLFHPEDTMTRTWARNVDNDCGYTFYVICRE